jgi:tetratricopeptide (TPR) repeat protein
MARLAISLLVIVALGLGLVPALLRADPPADDASIKTAVMLQEAMREARYYLQHGNDSRKAVELLESQLARVNGNADFLRLLRDAYRARIRDLYLANQPGQAGVYLDRLCVLDPSAANDATLRPQPETPKKTEASVKPAEKKQASIFPDFGKIFKMGATSGATSAEAPAKPSVARGVSAEMIVEDPFDLRHKREAVTATADTASPVQQLLARADQEFSKQRYASARSIYEQAYQVQPNGVAQDYRSRWAYCIYNQAVEQLNNQAAVPAGTMGELRQQIQGAIALAPALGTTGQELLGEIDKRSRGQLDVGAPLLAATAKHLGRNSAGWLVSETANFRIFHKQDDGFAERVAQVVEQTRSEMARKWFGSEPAAWDPRCEVVIYPSGQEYCEANGVPSASPGHSRIHSDETNAARVLARWMHMRLDTPAMLETVLPHETTHVVIAGRFGSLPVPRWADEGMACLTEPETKIQQHRRNLARCQQEGLLFGLKEIMTLENYPKEPRRVTAFYAQSVVLVEYLTSLHGPTVFTTFVRDGLREGYEIALQRHYGMGFAQLQQAWGQHISEGLKLAAGK